MASKKSGPTASTSKAPTAKTSTTRAQVAARAASPPTAEPVAGFLSAGRGYALGLRERALVCMNPKGQVLGSVPKELREGEVAEQLLGVVDFLKAHDLEALQAGEGWMLRSMPTPTSVLVAVWADDAYRRALENLVVVLEPAGEAPTTGFLKGVDAKKGVGLVDQDGETRWLKAEVFRIPHPILLGDLDDLRALAAELGLTQGQKQLFREVFAKPAELAPDADEIASFRGGKFEMLSHARGAAKALGYRTSGGWAVCRIFEGGRTLEARFWLGADDAMDEAVTEGLMWVDASGTTVKVRDVPPIAFSEGMRMASAIYGKRAVEKKEEDDDA